MKICLQMLTSFKNLKIWSLQVVVLLTTATKWTKIKKRARAERAKLLSLATSMQNCDILVDVTVVVAEAPY